MKNGVAVVSSYDSNCPEDAGEYFMQLDVDPELTLPNNQPDNYYLAKKGLYGTDHAEEPGLITVGYTIPVGLAADKSQNFGSSIVFYRQTANGMISQEVAPVAEVLSRSEVVCRHFVGKGLIPVCSVTPMSTYFRVAISLSPKRYRLVNRHGW